jgi:hypothetical protein
MTAKKLNQVLAIEKTVKAKREDEFTQLYQNVQKPELSIGFSRTYHPKTEDGEKLPPERKVVQVKVSEVCQRIVDLNKEIFNVTAAKDATNCSAKADLTVDGETIAKNVPATHLLWIEKRLLQLQELIAKLPTLPQDTLWQFDAGQGLYRSEPVETIKTKKIEDIVVVPGTLTKDHPAQTWKKVEDVNVGTWSTTHLSGAIPVDRKKQLLERVEKYMKATKEAREEANQTAVVELPTGVIVERIFAP